MTNQPRQPSRSFVEPALKGCVRSRSRAPSLPAGHTKTVRAPKTRLDPAFREYVPRTSPNKIAVEGHRLMAQLAPTPIRYVAAEPAEPMPPRGRDWHGYVALIREVTAAGYPPPPGYGELLARFGIEADLVVSDGREDQAR